MRALPVSIGLLHFVGIGGIGMSGIAEVLHNLGYKVQGSDLAESQNVKRLIAQGMKVSIGHAGENVQGANVVVISSAVKPDNPEVVAARAAGIPVVRRAEMLGELMRLRWTVAVAGTHGKTTTTTLVGHLFEQAGLDPTVITGGIVNAYGTNTRLGDGDWMVVETDESDGSFLRLPGTVAVVTNIDPEHLDHYGNFEALKAAFDRFVDNIPFYGFAVVCTDHPEVRALKARITDRKLISYGFELESEVRAVNVTTGPEGCRFDVVFSGTQIMGAPRTVTGYQLPMYGLHNVQNALAAIAIGNEMNIADPTVQSALLSFTGVKRRFTRVGEANGVVVIDDYGHHPVEIAAVLKAARGATAGKGKTIAVVQPHRYTRLSSLFDQFTTCFAEADTVIVADVYAAGETPIVGADRDHLVAGIKKQGHPDVLALPSPDELAALVKSRAQPGDFVVCLGAGNITQWAAALPTQLAALEPGKLKVVS
jgi:UDP-N-acetylmuramate--alanine ligase